MSGKKKGKKALGAGAAIVSSSIVFDQWESSADKA